MMTRTTKEKALIEGRSLLQQHGYNGFSFQDIADKLNIKKPSLYEHYSSKEELVMAILHDYCTRFDSWAESLKDLDPLDRVEKAFDVFYAFASDKAKICPVMALATDFQGVARNIQKEMRLFVDKWLTWLEEQIRDGQRSGQIRCDMDAKVLATFIYSQAMGSQFQARIKNDPKLTLDSAGQIAALIKVPKVKS